MKKINWADHFLNFVAVILGVSLAFFVNDKAEKKRNARELNQVVNSFIEELEKDSVVYVTYQIPKNEKQINIISEVIDKIQRHEKDSLSEKLSMAIGFNNYYPTAVTFSSLTASGKLNIITDFELRKKLANYYTILAEEAKFKAEFQVRFNSENILPWLLDHTDFVNQDLRELYNKQLTNRLIVYRSLINNKIRHYKRLTEEISDLLEDLQSLKDEKK